jgi:hypothetical protein
MQDGNVCLVPFLQLYIGIYNPTTNTYSRGPPITSPSYNYSGGVLLPDGKILFIPLSDNFIGIYDPVLNQFNRTIQLYAVNTVYMYWGGCLMQNGKVCMMPYESGAIGIYDPDCSLNFPMSVLLSTYLNKW